jgi:alpha-glucosidase
VSSLADPPVFRLAGRDGARLDFEDGEGRRAHVFVLEPDIVRVLVLPTGTLDHPRTWTIAPGADDVPDEGRDRFDLAGFARPAFVLQAEADVVRIETAALRLEITLRNFRCAWAMRMDDGWREIVRDRATQAYDFGWWDGRPRHYLERHAGEAYLGLGEVSGPLDRAGRRIRLSNSDALGYDPRDGDPLYKHIPFYLTGWPAEGCAFGLFYDTLADCEFDFGRAIDHYHGPFRSFVGEHGDLDYYVIAGPRPGQVVRRFTWLTGRPALTPRWSLGYSGSAMSYADAPDAQARMGAFLDRCAEHDMPCDSFHLSSGYTTIGERRHVFQWNRDKFPDPAGFAKSFAEHGVRIVANLKPCLMRGHPQFDAAQAAGLVVAEADGTPAWSQFWGDAGAWLDFTNPKTAAWWSGQVRTQLLDQGIAATWNDNNEFEIISPKALAHGFGRPFPAWEAKPLQTLLMLRASQAAQRAQAPDQRPFLVTRAGFAGMQRYAQTWSGDNATSWETLRFNLRMGLGLALSGVSNAGHDVGGFTGPPPDAELLVRWVQAGILLPRFSIHSWNDDGSVNEPWMHPEATATIRSLIRLRYRLIPYLYDLLWRHHRDFEAIVRPPLYDFPDDPEAWAEHDTLMIGPALLAAPVVASGQARRAVRLPAGADWIDWWTGERFAGGQTIERDAPWERPVLFGRAGTAIPLNLAEAHFGQAASERGLLVFPPTGAGAWSGDVFDDDGESLAGADDAPGWAYAVRCGADAIAVTLRGAPAAHVILPLGERRPLSVRTEA